MHRVVDQEQSGALARVRDRTGIINTQTSLMCESSHTPSLFEFFFGASIIGAGVLKRGVFFSFFVICFIAAARERVDAKTRREASEARTARTARTAREARTERKARTVRARRTVEYYEERSAMERGPFGAHDWPADAPFIRDLATYGRPIRRKFENYDAVEDESVRASENWLVDLQDMQLRSDASVADISPTTGIVDQRALQMPGLMRRCSQDIVSWTTVDADRIFDASDENARQCTELWLRLSTTTLSEGPSTGPQPAPSEAVRVALMRMLMQRSLTRRLPRARPPPPSRARAWLPRFAGRSPRRV